MIFNLIITLFALSLCESKRYDGFMLLRGMPASEEHLEFFKNVTKSYDVNVWQPPGLVNRAVDFIISPDHAEIVKSAARNRNISLQTLHSDIQSALDNQTVNTYSRRNTKSFNWESYYRAHDIVNWMMDLKTQYPEEISLFSIGKSLEGRDIMCMKMIFKGSKRRSKVVIEGGIHAREWIGTAMVTYIINELIHARNGLRDKQLQDIAYNYEWFVIPIFNIDGYEYSHTTDRMWRKNRRGGHGVDLNRNFDAAFGTVGVTLTDKDSEEYCGPKAFSEPETQHIRRFMQSTSKHLPISHYISFHAYGQLFIIPYAYTKKHLENFNEMKNIGDRAAAEIKKRYGTEYTVGTAFDTVGYMAAGVSACWAKKTFNIPFVNVFELRDTGKHGFALPANQIKHTCLETMDGLMEVLKPRQRTKLSGQDTDYDDQPNGQAITTLNGLVFSINVFFFWLFGFMIVNFFITLLAVTLCESKRYDGFMLLRGMPASEEHLDFFKNVTKNYDVNVWQPPGLVNKPVDFIISPDHAEIVKSAAKNSNISLLTLHSDIQSAFDNQTVNTYSRRNTKSFNWNSYYRAKDIVNWMKDIKSLYPKEISLFSIGKSLEGSDIVCMKIIFKGSKRRSKVVIEGGIHAREWISPAVVTYIINELIQARKGLRNKELQIIAYNYEWFIIPLFNIDGYEYSHTTDRMWRKNRRGGYGVDLNRNFDVAFGTVGVTLTDKKDDIYCGPKAFSEPETQHMRKFMQSISKNLLISHYISFHAYGQLFILPYAYTKKHLENFNEMKKIGENTAARIKKRYGAKYTVGTAFDTLGYMASGSSVCWAKKSFKIPYVNVFELRDSGKYGFALPANQIKHTCLETMDGLMELLKPRQRTKLSGQDDDCEEYEDQLDGQAMTTLNGLVISINVFLIWLFCI
ncbi:uncharacterized protein LOC133528500 [Cydia pomonella]|uniref:uncharacterized protein LOC133528500 n=1 Tax=Cydia pomonella TaxID=82600 RepID=UPI002ADD7604|nr:uncharacterized protein LOC133528500 [Cydia pomonella]